MKIQVLSDLHIEFESFEYLTTDCNVVVLAGDIHVKDKGAIWAAATILDKPVLYVLGNHEFYGKAYPKLIGDIKAKVKGTNIHVLEKDVVSIEGVNFLGCTLWTNFELFGEPRISGYECQQIMSDYKKIRVSPQYYKLRSIDVALIHKHSVNWLKSELACRRGETNVVITHHGPSIRSLPKGKEVEISSAAYVSDLEDFIDEYKPTLWVHGHMHDSSDYTIGDCQVVCNPRGYPDEKNPDFSSTFTVDV